MLRRSLFLVRHGQYDTEDSTAREGGLTETGRAQARQVAQRLRGMQFDAVYCSTLRRAEETAAIIAAELPGAEVQRARVLCECVPCIPPAFAHYFTKTRPEDLEHGASQSLAAYERFFKRPGRASRRELLVCHGNLIRSFVCRALDLPIESWLNFNTHNCSLTIIHVFGDGLRIMESFNDIGHLPAELHTR